MSSARSLLIATALVAAAVLWITRDAAPARSQSVISPVLQWAWGGSDIFPEYDHSLGTPVVIDVVGDGEPALLFVTFKPNPEDHRGGIDDGVIRAVFGDDGVEIFTAGSPAEPVSAGPMAAGDIDGDGRPEIIATWVLAPSPSAPASYGLAAFEHDGSPKWRTEVLGTFEDVPHHGPVIGDLNRDGVPEIVMGSTVLDRDGVTLWEGASLLPSDPNSLARGIILDINADGGQEVLADGYVFSKDGVLLSRFGELFPSPLDHGFHAAADLDGDAYPEPVWVAKGSVFAMEHVGALKWRFDLPTPASPTDGLSPTGGGPPTIGDADGDGQVEIGVATSDRYVLINADGSLAWTRSINDSSNVSSSTMFDFDGDGSWEIVHADNTAIRILDGTDGSAIWSFARASAPGTHFPIVVDIDGDGYAEIIDNGDPLGDPPLGEPLGPLVFGPPPGGAWAGTRALWNQHAYHVDHVRDDGSIPGDQLTIGTSHNTYRVNIPEPALTATPTFTPEPTSDEPVPTDPTPGTGTPEPTAEGTATPTRIDETGTPTPTPTLPGGPTHTSPTSTPTPTGTATAPPTPDVTPAPSATCVCRKVRDGVPPAVIADALANPGRIMGWGARLDPGKPAGPFNPLRECLNLSNPGIAFHPLFNSVVYEAGCR